VSSTLLPSAQAGSLLVPGDPPSRRDGGVGPPLELVGFEFSLRTGTLDELEEVARALDRRRVAEQFAALPETEEAALLATCHRVELLLLVRSAGAVGAWTAALPGRRSGWRRHRGRQLVHHLVRVAAGQESLAVGEGEVRRQVRSAMASVTSRHPRPVLRELLAGAASAADEVDPRVPADRSIAAVAARRLLELVPRHPARVLVVGSGTVGRQVAECLAPSAVVTVLYHQRPPDAGFLASTGVSAAPLEELATRLPGADAVVTAAKFGHRGLRAKDVPPGRSILLLDLGMPRNIDPDVRSLPGVRLVDLEELHALSTGAPEAGGKDHAVREVADRLADRTERALLEPWVDSVRRAAERVRRDELEKARAFLGALDPGQEAALDLLTRRLVSRLLLEPTERIRRLPTGPEGELQRRVAVTLLRPSPPEP
jgi:glutamyl-tRNA reductase